MTEPPGIPSVLGIESVEWLAEGGENLTVRVTGRWRRRRPAWGAQPVLVVEAAGRRFRFPAIPEPPSLTGTGPGMWRISFAVPAALAPELGGRTWLQVGAVVVPLPAAAEPVSDVSGSAGTPEAPAAPETPAPPTRTGAQPPAETRPPSLELEAEDARRRAREAEEAAREAEAELEGLARRIRALEEELSYARAQAERLSGEVAEGERTRRAAEQRAHAEQALRRDLARQLAARDRGGERARANLAAAQQRIAELERELRDALRRGDEAEQVAAAAVAARQRAEQRAELAEAAAPAEPKPSPPATPTGPKPSPPATPTGPKPSPPAIPGPSPAGANLLRLERALVVLEGERRGHVLDEPAPVPSPSPPRAETPVTRAAEAPEAPLPGEALVPVLRQELQARATAEAALCARLVDAEAKLRARTMLEQRTSELIALLRQELDGLRGAFERERRARQEAERRAEELARELDERRGRTEEAYQAIAELRETLEALRTAEPPQSPEPPAAQTEPPGRREPPAAQAEAPAPRPPEETAEPRAPVVELERLNDARQRLRAAIAPRGEEANQPVPRAEAPAGAIPDSDRTQRAWLEAIWTGLARTQPELAGRLLVELLPAQREAFPERVAYDLVFGQGRGCAQVTVGEGVPMIRHADAPRAAGEVDFQVFGDPAAIARLLIAGAWRRRFGRGVARVRGKRDRLAALRALPAVKLGLRGLHRIGVRPEPELALRLVALVIDPAWTARESFAVGYRAQGGAAAYLLIRDGQPPRVTTESPAGRVMTTLGGPADAAALVLSGERGDEVTVIGEEWPLALLRKWIKRAQSG